MNTNGFQEMITSDGQVSANGTLYAAKNNSYDSVKVDNNTKQ